MYMLPGGIRQLKAAIWSLSIKLIYKINWITESSILVIIEKKDESYNPGEVWVQTL